MCKIRHKTVVYTPEEQVRQKVIHWLIAQGVPSSFMEVETGLQAWNPPSRERVDVLVRHPNKDLSAGEFWLMVECKAPGESLELAQWQLQRYQQSVRFSWAIVTDGSQLLIFDVEAHWSIIHELPKWSINL